MNRCFHFFINVDQCLNMSDFDMFFYKLESQQRFYLSSATFFKKNSQNSLKKAIEDIRMYLDKYPFRVGDYQITLAMRQPFNEKGEWKNSVLYRILRILYELQAAHIFIGSKESIEKTVNIIMLYDSDFYVESPEFGEYWAENFLKEYSLLLEQLNINMKDIHSDEEFFQCLKDTFYQMDKNPKKDKEIWYLLKCFVERFATSDTKSNVDFDMSEEEYFDIDNLEFEKKEVWSSSKTNRLDYSWLLKQFIKEKSAGMQIFERMIDKNNRKANILALLRVVEFINMEEDEIFTGEKGIRSLYSINRDRWNKVWTDTTLEDRYSKMLWEYQNSLKQVLNDIERPYSDFGQKEKLPKYELPKKIKISKRVHIEPRENRMDELTMILKRFLSNSRHIETMKGEWESAYKELKTRLGRMELDLKIYADDLSRQYKFALESRKEETRRWKNQKIYADRETEVKILQVGDEREKKLANLKSPHMNPSLKFQDQLNMENALEQANLEISFYIACQKVIQGANFALFMIICALLCLGHYTLFQLFSLQSMGTASGYIVYCIIAIIGMILTWKVPFLYFQKKMKKSVNNLQKSMEQYVAGYFKKEEDFCTYINEINELDYITRYLRLLIGADAAAKEKARKYLWHKVQIKRHLLKLTFFRGLIDNHSMSLEGEERKIFLQETDELEKDVVDCRLYWPQG